MATADLNGAPERADTTPTTSQVRALLAAAGPHIRRINAPGTNQAHTLSIALTIAALELFPRLSQDEETALCRAAIQAVPRRHAITATELADTLATLGETSEEHERAKEPLPVRPPRPHPQGVAL